MSFSGGLALYSNTRKFLDVTVDKLQKSYFGFINYSSAMYLKKCIHSFHMQYAEYMRHQGNTRISKTDIFIPLRRFINGPKKTAKN